MGDVTALEARINAALGRIETGLGQLADAGGVAGGDTGSDENTQALLEEERAANAQLEERVRALKQRQDTKMAELTAQVAAQKEQMGALDAEMQRLRESNADLRAVGAELRAAATAGVADAELINRAIMAEVEALSAQRASEVTEIDAILSELKPLIAEG